MGGKGMEIILWFFMGCLVVLVVTHAPGFAQSVQAVGGEVNTLGTTLTGANVNNAVYAKSYTN